eukprot:TRINITY_DN3902_c0_g1_i2.p1 TRINITY_DN3902_c0_g1~~TRINITY_DN3902_c0_g1_i2.p1  ORF type:complete len:179 (+),score=54.05 TRINITY_DN3902_c0_g1_i2:327-863(+)
MRRASARVGQFQSSVQSSYRHTVDTALSTYDRACSAYSSAQEFVEEHGVNASYVAACAVPTYAVARIFKIGFFKRWALVGTAFGLACFQFFPRQSAAFIHSTLQDATTLAAGGKEGGESLSERFERFSRKLIRWSSPSSMPIVSDQDIERAKTIGTERAAHTEQREAGGKEKKREENE